MVWSSFLLNSWGKEFWRSARGCTGWELSVINLNVHFLQVRDFFVLRRMVGRILRGVLTPGYFEPGNFPSVGRPPRAPLPAWHALAGCPLGSAACVPSGAHRAPPQANPVLFAGTAAFCPRGSLPHWGLSCILLLTCSMCEVPRGALCQPLQRTAPMPGSLAKTDRPPF